MRVKRSQAYWSRPGLILLISLRATINQNTEKKYFNIPELDALITHQTSRQPVQQSNPPAAPAHQFNNLWDPELPHPPAQASVTHHPAAEQTQFPVLELISPPSTHHPSGSGKTSLIYLITALAILPATISTTPIGGQNAAVIILDPLFHFSVRRLTEIMAVYIKQKLDESPSKPPNLNPSPLKSEIKTTIMHALQHIHIFRPQSWPSALATLSALPDYLFDRWAHSSMSRRVHSIILEDVDAFYWHTRASSPSPSTSASASIAITESTTATAATSRLGLKANGYASPISTASAILTTTLLSLSRSFSAVLITTSHSPSPFPSSYPYPANPHTYPPNPPTNSIHTTNSHTYNTSYRAPLPLTWPLNTLVTRLAVRRVEVLRFAPGMSVEEAEAERGARWEVVSRGRFECWRLGAGEKKGLGAGRDGDGRGFVFRVGRGVEVEVEGKGR